MKGVDYSWGRPDLQCLKQSGYDFVARYYDAGNPVSAGGKTLNADERDAILAAGLQIFTVFESTGGASLERWLRGYAALRSNRPLDLRGPFKGIGYFNTSQGQFDGYRALAFARYLNQPHDLPIFFAVDYGASNDELSRVFDYREAAQVVLGQEYVAGIYGSYWVVQYMLDRGVPCWQTYAWSGGNRDSRAMMYQYKNGQQACGAEVDLNVCDTPGWGAEENVGALQKEEFDKWVNETIGPAADAPRGTVKGDLNYLLGLVESIKKEVNK